MSHGIFGTGAFAREIRHYIHSEPSDLGQAMDEDRVVFITDKEEFIGEQISEHKIIALDDLEMEKHKHRKIVIALADSATRRRIAKLCEGKGIVFGNILHPSAIVNSGLPADAGIIICPLSIITDNVQIGRHFHCNLNSYVGHDCTIGDFVTFAPRVNVNGNVEIRDNVYIGTAATIRNGSADKPLVIGENSTIGMGAVVTKSVPANCTVFGNPARIIKKTG